MGSNGSEHKYTTNYLGGVTALHLQGFKDVATFILSRKSDMYL